MAEPVYGLKKDDVRRIGEVLERIETDPRFTIAPTDGSSNARDPVQHWCKITSTSTTAGRYPGTRYRYDAAAATWTAFEAIWIVTPNGETLSSTSTYYRCNAEGFANGRMVFLAVVPAGTGTTIFVKEVDGSPNFYASELHFDQADGFVVTNPSAGVARFDIAAAGASTVGVVTTGTQTIAGNKTFSGTTTMGALETGGAYTHLYSIVTNVSGSMTAVYIEIISNGLGYSSETFLVNNKARILGDLQVQYGDVSLEGPSTTIYGDTYIAGGGGSGIRFFGTSSPTFFQGPINHVPSSGAGATYTSAEQTMLDDLVTAVNAILTAFEAYGLL